jgi:hypothetical protein
MPALTVYVPPLSRATAGPLPVPVVAERCRGQPKREGGAAAVFLLRSGGLEVSLVFFSPS